MDEMTLLEDMCSMVPQPGAERLAAVRATVLEAGRPVPTARPVPGRSHRGRGWTPVLSRPQLALTSSLAVAAAAAVVVTAAAVLGGGIPFSGSSRLVPSAQAAQVLQRAAAAVLAQGVPRNNQFVYTKITGNEGVFTTPGTYGNVVEQMWQSADGLKPGAVEVTSSAGMLTPGGYSTYNECGQASVRCVLAILPARNLPPAASYAGLRTLPTSPAALLAYIDKHYRPTSFPGETAATVRWSAFRDILRDEVAIPPKLAAAIFRAAATLPGTVLLHHVVDAAGRPGIAVAMQQYGLSSELIFSPSTYRFVGSADVVTSRGSDSGNYPIGTIFDEMAVLRTAFTSTAPRPSSANDVFQPDIASEFLR